MCEECVADARGLRPGTWDPEPGARKTSGELAGWYLVEFEVHEAAVQEGGQLTAGDGV